MSVFLFFSIWFFIACSPVQPFLRPRRLIRPLLQKFRSRELHSLKKSAGGLQTRHQEIPKDLLGNSRYILYTLNPKPKILEFPQFWFSATSHHHTRAANVPVVQWKSYTSPPSSTYNAACFLLGGSGARSK